MESIALPEMAGRGGDKGVVVKERCSGGGGGCFQMPLHYPRYTKADYETMPEWKLDSLLREYGLPVMGEAAQKRTFAMGAFLWPSY